MVVGLIYVPLLLQGIGRAEYGLYQFIGSIIAYMAIVNTTLGSGVSRFYCKYYAEGDEDGMANTLAIATRAIRVVSVASVFVGAICMVLVRLIYVDSFSAWELDESCMLLGVLVVNLMVTMSNTVSASVINAHEDFVFLKDTQLVERLMSRFNLLYDVLGTRVGDMNEQVRGSNLGKRRAETRNQMVRKITHEADGIAEKRRSPTG